jgi:transposase
VKEKNRLHLHLSHDAVIQLVDYRDHHPTPYIRERAAAILKIYEGKSPHWVANNGLLKKRDPDTVYSWLYSYSRYGIKGLFQRRRNPPQKLSRKEQRFVFLEILKKSPEDYGFHRQRWTLQLMQLGLSPLRRNYSSLSGIWYLLQRLYLSWKRGRPYTKSNDPNYNYKVRRIRGILGYCRRHPRKAALLAVDEFTFYRQPPVGYAWWRKGRCHQPKAKRARKQKKYKRIVGALNCVTGGIDVHMADKITVPVFIEFIQQLRKIYPDSMKLYILMDNWPSVHKHHKVLEKMEILDIEPAFTPTYTPAANPIERIWHKLTQEMIYHHRYSKNWLIFKEQIKHWFDLFHSPNKQTLRYAGLLNQNRAINVKLK